MNNIISDFTNVRAKRSDRFANFECSNHEEHAKVEVNEYKEHVESIINDIFTKEKELGCQKCGSKLYSHTATKCDVLTITGYTTIYLKRLRCSNVNCLNITVPGINELPEKRITASVSKLICDMAIDLSFNKTSRKMNDQHNIKISASKVKKCVEYESSLIVDEIEEDAKKIYQDIDYRAVQRIENPPEVLYVAIDGCYVHKWKQKHSGFEIKAVTISTGIEEVSKNRRRLLDRVGYANYSNVDEFGKCVAALIHKYSSDNTKILVLSDGAKWINCLVRDYLPDNSIHLLDIFHLKKKINEVFGRRKTSDYDNKIRKDMLEAVDEYDVGKLLDILTNWKYKPDKEKQVRDLQQYILNNAKQIQNHQNEELHGSGYIEKAVDIMVARRLKMRAMGWTKKGANAMLKLKLLEYNGGWEEYWKQRKSYGIVA